MAKYGTFVCEISGLRTDMMTGSVELVLSVRKEHIRTAQRMVDEARGKTLSVDIKDFRRKRSLDANAYMWALCSKIADKLGITREEVYRRNIKEVSCYEPLPIRAEAVDKFSEAWSKNGIGWFAEVVDDSKISGYKLVYAYYGSSTYDTEQMSRLIDNVIADAESIGIDPLPPREIERMKATWSQYMT